MADLKNIEDVRLIILYNSGKKVVLFNQGYQREDNALVFQSYTIDSENGVLTFTDTVEESKVSDLQFLSEMKSPTIGVLELCRNGIASSGFLVHEVNFLSHTEMPSSREGYKTVTLVCQGGYRVLSKSEMLRGSRFQVKEA